MSSYKEYYTEVFSGLIAKKLITGIAMSLKNNASLGGLAKKAKLSPETLSILSGGEFNDWESNKQKRFFKIYNKFQRKNKRDKKTTDAEYSYEAVKEIVKNKEFKKNKFFKHGMKFKDFVKKLKMTGMIRSTSGFLKNTLSKHGDSIVTLLKVLK